MRRIPTLLVFLALICSGCNLPLPTTPLPASATQTDSPPTALPDAPQPTRILSTASAPNATTFPDPNAYNWKPLIDTPLQRPTDIQADGSGRLFVLEKRGFVRIIQNGQLSPDPLLDITDRVNEDSNEMGLLGMALHPNFSQNGYFYVNYTGAGGDTFISRFQANGDRADASTEVNLLHIKQPFPNHNGGSLAFGPDGFLYAGLGDGGSQGDPSGNAQSQKTLLGKILRIDVDSKQPYAIPTDNPFGNEIFYYGLRNPWRISFDKATGDLYIADVGQGDWEELDFVSTGSPGGLNFGWNIFEGNHDYKNNGATGDYVAPIAEYSHAEGGCAVTGGYVYRGSMPEWNGIYLYGDYCTGKVWGLIKAGEQWQSQLLFETHVLITSFGQDEKGEVYMLSDDGEVYQLVRK
ncbi:MAG: PQQ-dependent sugar dehydrogenase [Chloroflexota bacterium]